MSKRRSRLEIILTILEAIRDGVDKPTRIMYAANMSWEPVQRILSRLVEQGLVLELPNTRSRQSKKRYQITEKGEKIIEYFNGASEILAIEELFARD